MIELDSLQSLRNLPADEIIDGTPALAGWATHLVGDRDLGHDMATDAFVRLINSWPGVDQPRPWLYTTVGNLVKDHWRKRGRERTAYQREFASVKPMRMPACA